MLFQLQYLRIEAKKPSASASFRQDKVKEREKEKETLKTNIKRAALGFGNLQDRDDLLTSPSPLSSSKLESLSSMDQRTRLLHETDKLDEGTEKIRSSRRAADEAVEIGIGILGNLDEQNERLRHAKDRVCSLSFFSLPLSAPSFFPSFLWRFLLCLF